MKMTGPFNLSGPERRIVHFNVLNFAVAVERRNDPALKYRPVIIAPEGGSRAGVCDMSQEESFMAPLALELVPGIGAEDLARLRELNFRFAGQVAGLGPERLSEVFGRRASRIYNAVCGIDNTPVREIGQNASYRLFFSCRNLPDK